MEQKAPSAAVAGGGQAPQAGRQQPAYDPNNGGHFGMLLPSFLSFALKHVSLRRLLFVNFLRLGRGEGGVRENDG